jgi:hypothetical protein
MVEINLYGNLRKYARDFASPGKCMFNIEPNPGETIESLMGRLGISAKEINHIFFNSKLLASRSRTATMFGLPQVGDNTMEWDLAVPVSHGDRLGVFGLDISILSM